MEHGENCLGLGLLCLPKALSFFNANRLFTTNDGNYFTQNNTLAHRQRLNPPGTQINRFYIKISPTEPIIFILNSYLISNFISKCQTREMALKCA